MASSKEPLRTSELRTYEIAFSTGHDDSMRSEMRYVRVKDISAKKAESQIFKMYLSVNTTIYGIKELLDE